MFQHFLRERLQKKYTYKLFTMVPPELKKCLKRILTLTFDERPPYEYIIQSLMACFIKALNE